VVQSVQEEGREEVGTRREGHTPPRDDSGSVRRYQPVSPLSGQPAVYDALFKYRKCRWWQRDSITILPQTGPKPDDLVRRQRRRRKPSAWRAGGSRYGLLPGTA
jgi:hypothetical protein